MTRLVPALLLLCACAPDDAAWTDPDVTPGPDLADPVDPLDPPTTGLPGTAAIDEVPFADTAQLDRLMPVGTWDDLSHWDFWQDLVADDSRHHAANELWGFDTRQRFRVVVTDGAGLLPDAEVTLYRRDDPVFSTRTDEQGEANLFGGLFDGAGGPWNITAIADRFVQQKLNARALGDTAQPFDVTDDTVERPTAVDVMWAIDTRAPMADFLPWLQDRLPDVLVELHAALGADLRSTVVLFDDQGLQTGEWSTDALDALARLDAAVPEGSGRAPLDDVLAFAAAPERWRDDAQARLLFVLSASTDLGRPSIERVHTHVASLAAAGVRIHPVQADPDTSGSFLFRNLALATGGQWSFVLTPGRAVGTDLVGDYPVSDVGTLLTRTVLEAAPR